MPTEASIIGQANCNQITLQSQLINNIEVDNTKAFKVDDR